MSVLLPLVEVLSRGSQEEEGSLEEAALTEVDQVESSEEGQEGELVGDDEVQGDQRSGPLGVEDLNTHHGIFPIIEVSSGKK